MPPASPSRATPDASDHYNPKNIEGRDDVETIVTAFYSNIASDPVLGRFFDDVDLDAHIPTLVDFWSSVLFHTGTYRGRPFQPHAALDRLEARHFRRWLDRLTSVVESRYAGPRADQMLARARQIATVFQTKLDCIDEADIARRFPDAA
jgi:hemoglobin